MVLVVLGWMPQIAKAQWEICVSIYTDYYVDTVQEQVEAWGFIEDYFDQYYCAQQVIYEWPYWEHTYEATALITSPTQNTAHDVNSMANVPYGGGSALASTSISIVGEPGDYVIDWFIWILCTVGGYFVDFQDQEVAQAPPVPLIVRLTFDDGPTCCGDNNSRTVVATLASNVVQSNIPATFFVQTHVENRGAHSGGIETMNIELAGGHDVVIHTGSTEDHVKHTVRVGLPGYDGGTNALEDDLIRAKVRIASLQGGSVPTYVRAPYGETNSAVLATYASQNLVHKHWDVDSEDSVGTPSQTSILAALAAGIASRLAQQDRDIVILFHDIHGVTANNLQTYLLAIKTAVETAGYSLQFAKL